MHREEIRIRGNEEPIVHEVRETRHGPLLDSYLTGRLRPATHPLEDTYALRWVGAEHSIRPSALVDVANVSSFEGFRDAASALECPGQNLVYADVDGTIGYQCTGLYPIRRAGDGTVPVPGWTAEHEWDGFVPFEELPSHVNPARAYLVTANDRNHADDYPHLIGQDFHAPDRTARISELLEARNDHTVDTCRAIQGDTVSVGARDLLPRISLSDERARDLFDGWDHNLSADSAAAALWEVFIDELARRAVDGKEPLVAEYMTDRELFRCRAVPALLDGGLLSKEQLDQALAAAWDRCAEAMGPDPAAWRWGDIHRARFTHPLGRMPGLEPLFVAAEHPLGGDDQTVNKAGFEGDGPFDVCVIPSWRVVYDLANLDESKGILPTGQSGNPASPHWNDQTNAWAAGELRSLPFTRAAVEASATDRLMILPG